MLSDLREGPVSEIVHDPELAIVLETTASCLRGRVDSPSIRDAGFHNEVVLDKGSDDMFAEGSRGM